MLEAGLIELPVSSPGESPMPHDREDGFSDFRLIFQGMPYIEKRFSDNSDYWRINDVQLLGRASVKRESRSRPTKNRFTN